jgi:hypothetical protein
MAALGTAITNSETRVRAAGVQQVSPGVPEVSSGSRGEDSAAAKLNKLFGEISEAPFTPVPRSLVPAV